MVKITSNNMDVDLTGGTDNDDGFSSQTLTLSDTTATTVTVTVAEDGTTDNEVATLTHEIMSPGPSGDAAYHALGDMTVMVEVTDNDVAGVTFVATDVATLAEGASDTYTVVLDQEPTHDVTVRITSSNLDVTVMPASLTFVNADPAEGQALWSTVQTITVTARVDADSMDEEVVLTHAVSSSDANYNSATLIAAIGQAAANAEDGDAAAKAKARADAEDAALKVMVEVTDVSVGVRFSETSLMLTEDGIDGTYTVVLQSLPDHPVTVAIESDNDDVTVSPTSIVFSRTAGTPTGAFLWSEPQTVTVTAADEAVADEDRSDESATLTHAISSNDLRYNALSDQTVMANVKDDDPSLTLSATELDVMEGESGDFTVKLAADPDSNHDNEAGVEVKVEVSGSDGVTVEPAELTFTSDNWDEAQTVTVMAVLDEDDRDGTATVTLKALVGTGDDIQVYDAEFTQLVSILLTEPAPEPVTVRVPGQTRTVTETRTRTVTRTVEVPAAPAAPNVIGMTGSATATEVDGRVLITRHDGGPSLVVDIGGFIRDDSFGQTYQVVRRADGMIVRQWVSPNSPLVYQINWAVVNSAFTVPVGVVGAIPLDDQVGAPGQLVRRFDGGDDRIFSYEMGQWRHVPNIPTFQALGFYWCDVTAADSAFFDRISIGAPHPATGMAARGDYPNCSTG